MMNDLEKRVADLENRVRILEETLETIKSMGLSEQMEGYIKKKSQALKVAELMNSVSDAPAFDLSQEEKKLQDIQKEKNDLDESIAKALADTNDYTDEADDPSFFGYEIESGKRTPSFLSPDENIYALSKYVGYGIRITSYNGFDSERVIIPKEIDGKPVVSIGEKAFMNASVKKVLIPSSVKAILKSAFYECKNLKHLVLPESVVYLEESCFSWSGIEEVRFSDSLTSIPRWCFSSCKNLKNFCGGKNLKVIEKGAFSGCRALRSFSLPETIEEIEDDCFSETGIQTLIIPADTKTISAETFKGHSSNKVTLVFLGKETAISAYGTTTSFCNVSVIYCLPGSHAQKYAREHRVPVKPLSEFDMTAMK